MGQPILFFSSHEFEICVYVDDFVCYYYDGVGQSRVTWLRVGISFLRGYDYRLEGNTQFEGTFRYGH